MLWLWTQLCGRLSLTHTHKYRELLLGGVGWAHTVGCFCDSSSRGKKSASSALLCLWGVTALLWFLRWFKCSYRFFYTSYLFIHWISHSCRGNLCKCRVNSRGVEYSWSLCSKTANVSLFFMISSAALFNLLCVSWRLLIKMHSLKCIDRITGLLKQWGPIHHCIFFWFGLKGGRIWKKREHLICLQWYLVVRIILPCENCLSWCLWQSNRDTSLSGKRCYPRIFKRLNAEITQEGLYKFGFNGARTEGE